MEKKPKPPSARGPSEWFTGEVWLDPIARGEEPSRVRVNAVHFTPGGAHRLALAMSSARPSTSPRGRGGSSPPAASSSGSCRATSSTRLPPSGTGTVPRPTTS